MTTGRIRGAIVLTLVSSAAPTCMRAGGSAVPAAPVIIDGAFGDWSGSTGANVGPALRLAADAHRVYGLLDMGESANLQALDGTLRIVIDGDGEIETGAHVDGFGGADLVIDFSPGAEPGMRVLLPPDSVWVDSYTVGLAYAPTHASNRFEISLQRTQPGGRVVIGGPRLRAGVTFPNGAADVITLELPPAARPLSATLPTTAIARAPGTDLRVATWNLGDRTPLVRPLPLQRILAALDADVVLFDEINPAIDAGVLRTLLPDSTWSLILGLRGGRQRTAVASRWPLERARTVVRVDYPDSLQDLTGLPMSRLMQQDLRTAAVDGVPTMLAVAKISGRNVLFAPLDLLCCGRAGSAEDRARFMAANALAAAIRQVAAAGEADAVVVGGDLNLVGSTLPLEALVAGGDPAGGDLQAVSAATLDRTSVSTWRAPGPFPPGRLDWLLYSPSTLAVVGAFVFDEAAFDAVARGGLGLVAGDSEVLDHLPVVADFRIIAPAQR